MKLVAATAVIWAAIAIVWWLTVGAEVAKAQQTPTWEEIASFYAGRPIAPIEYRDNIGGAGRTLAGSGRIELTPAIGKQLSDFLANPRKNPGFNSYGLATLIHEALHNRAPQPGTGFSDWGDENQANALGSELIPDLLQRFFGIPINSPLSRQYLKSAKNLSNYLGAYAR